MRIDAKIAALELKAGKVVAVPTDTVYGLAALLTHVEAIEALYILKGRPKHLPLIVQIAYLSQIYPFLNDVPEDFLKLTDHFWPGALTLVLPVKIELIPEQIRSGYKTVGFRIPAHPLLLEILEVTGPLVVTSANPSGSQAAISAEQVETYFGNMLPLIDGGIAKERIESTILLFEEGRWQLLRQGAISVEVLAEIIGYQPKVHKQEK